MTREVRGMAPPPSALLLSLLSLSVPILGTTVFRGLAGEEYGVLLWLTALIPALLLTYYRGWKGASLALVLGMLGLATTQFIIVSFGTGQPDWSVLLVVVAVYLVLSIGIGVMGEILLRQRLSAEGMALTDPLTNLPNRRHATVFLEAAVAGAERGRPVSVVLFDIDHFKSINDTYGHATGDEVLKDFGEVMAGSTRRMDLVARFGGEEFLAVLPESGAEEARGYAERIRSGLRECDRMWGPVTVSAGVAQYEGGMSSADILVAAADRALYRAKEAGRDRVVLASELTGSLPGYDTGDDERITAEGPPATAKAPGELPAVAPAEAPSDATRWQGSETILVVDDDDDARYTVARVLKHLGYKVLQQGDPREAIPFFQEHRRQIDLVVTDVVMPAMNGLTLVDRLTRTDPKLRVLYMSGYIQGEVSWSGVPGSVTGFLEKPITIDELGRAVRSILDTVA